jgi:chemotaxis protein CheX
MWNMNLKECGAMMKTKQEQLEFLLPYFIESIRNVFETMVFMPVTAGERTPKSQGLPRGYVSGTISLAGEEINGNLSIIFSLPSATAIFRAMMGLGNDADVNQNEVNDVVGEIANMVAGSAKAKLQEKNVHFKIGLPTVVVGEGHYIEPPRNVETVVLPIKGSAGEFFMEISC